MVLGYGNFGPFSRTSTSLSELAGDIKTKVNTKTLARRVVQEHWMKYCTLAMGIGVGVNTLQLL